VLAIVATSCVIAACGSSSSSTSGSGASGSATTTASATGPAAFAQRRTALAACLKKYGVTLPAFRRPGGSSRGGAAPGSTTTPGGGPPGGSIPGARRGFFGGHPPSAKMQAALKACGANFGSRRGFGGRLSHTAINQFVACVRKHGYNMPAPNFSGRGSVFPANIRTNKQFVAASRACVSLLRPPGGAPPGTAQPQTSSS
jgi:hypothetical protein